jgi:hypothetical protein
VPTDPAAGAAMTGVGSRRGEGGKGAVGSAGTGWVGSLGSVVAGPNGTAPVDRVGAPDTSLPDETAVVSSGAWPSVSDCFIDSSSTRGRRSGATRVADAGRPPSTGPS